MTNDLMQKPFRISSFLEYVQYFGDPQRQSINVTVNKLDEPINATAPSPSNFLMYYGVRSFYDNGGGPCYIFSLGTYPSSNPTSTNLYDDSGANSALNQIKKVDEITLLVFPDLASLSEDNFYAVYKKALMQCGDLKDRFTIMDVYPNADMTTGIDSFRNKIGTTELKFGAAYFPYLRSVFNYNYTNSDITLSQTDGYLNLLKFGDVVGLLKANSLGDVLNKAILDLTSDNKNDRLKLLNTTWTEMQQFSNDAATAIAVQDAIDLINTDLAGGITVSSASSTALTNAANAFKDKLNESIKTSASRGLSSPPAPSSKIAANTTAQNIALLGPIVTDAFYAKVIDVIAKLYVELPPSASIAGVYAYVDRTRGVWKSPANVTVQSVIEPMFKVSDAEQASLNVSDTGKSINVIRTFTGRGVQVWGARTLDGNSNEWRYISVRRFFNMVEDQLKKHRSHLYLSPIMQTHG
ncbi:MAG: phage tail sheath subtilisin-like domain-containing protein [Segetibacter sp.]